MCASPGYRERRPNCIVPAGFDDADPADVAKFQALAQTIADGFAATAPYASLLSSFSISRADDYAGRAVNPESDEIWYNSILIEAASVCDYNQIIVIAHNSGWAGGSPGFYSVVGSGTPASCNQSTCTGEGCPWTSTCSWDENIAYTALHETGHTFAGLRHQCDSGAMRQEVERLLARERVPMAAPDADDPINCGVESSGNSDTPCVEWNRPEFLSWVLPGDPNFGCYATCDGRPEWYRAWFSSPNVMCIDYPLEYGFTPVDRKLLADTMGKPNLRPYTPTGYAAPVVPAARQGTHDPDTLYAGAQTFFDWHFINENTTAEGDFYVELWVDDTREIRYPFSDWGAGWVTGFDDWNIGVATPGWHRVRLVTDPDNTVQESDEDDNVWEEDFYWSPIEGWKGEYYANPDLADREWLTRDDFALDFDWQYGAPDEDLPVEEFSARWTRSLPFAAGDYRFHMLHDDGARLYVDGGLALDKWDTWGYWETVDLFLPGGSHDIQMEMYENTGAAGASLWWERLDISGWRGEYYNNDTLTNHPVLVRDDGPTLYFDWEGTSPDPLVQADHFSVRWTNRVDLAGGAYQFDIFHDDGARLYIDDVLKFENWCNDCRLWESVVVENLSAGPHALRLEAYENAGWAGAGLSWTLVQANPQAVQPAITITGADRRNILLSWQHASANSRYQVWRAGTPYFTPGAAGVLLGEVAAEPWSYEDANVLGDPDVKHYYVVRSISGSAWADSAPKGEFDFKLTPGSR